MVVGAIVAILLAGLRRGNLREQPAEVETHEERGVDLHRQGKLDEAIAAQREVIRLRPDLAEVQVAVGNALRGDLVI